MGQGSQAGSTGKIYFCKLTRLLKSEFHGIYFWNINFQTKFCGVTSTERLLQVLRIQFSEYSVVSDRFLELF